jgi:hypothetical protein
MTYLMDSIAATTDLLAASPTATADPVMTIYPDLVQRFAGTPRYLFDEASIATAVELTLGRPKVLLEAIRHIRVPYRRLWVEWPESGREKLRKVFGWMDTTTNDITRPVPSHTGFLLECEASGRRGTVTWAWHRSGDPANIAPIGCFFDLDRDHPMSKHQLHGLLNGNLGTLWQDNPPQLEALLAIWRTAEHRPSNWGRDFLAVLNDAAHEAFCYADVVGEYIMVWATLLLLTASRPIIDYTPVSLAKLNRTRRQKGRTLLLDHTRVTMHLDDKRIERLVANQPLGYTRKSPRVHCVSSYLGRRGDRHWVVTPYVRGKGETLHRVINVKR